MKRAVLTILLAAALLLGLVGAAGAAPPQDNPGKGPQNLTKIVFIHYPQGVMAKGGIPGPPDGGGDGGGKDKPEKLWYDNTGYYWLLGAVQYVVEDDVSDGFVAAIDAAFDEWEATGASIDFKNAGVFDGVPSSYELGKATGKNEIGWIQFSLYGLPSNAIAVTTVWVFEGSIVEVDMAMNGELRWTQNEVSGDPDEAVGLAEHYDVQSIATHEAGHWLMLGDLYNRPAREQTMYGYGATGEVKKRSLESGDVAGALEIYP